MQLDVIIPTYNRQELLKRTLDSLLAAKAPTDLDVRVTVVDNNSKDETKQVIEGYMERFDNRLHYLFEGRQGRSSALNAGIAATNGELVGMIDDDEEIDQNWYARIYSAFTEQNVDFIGGPYMPRWGAKPPTWLPRNYRAVIGWIDGGDKELVFGDSYSGMLMGGNAVLTRSILKKVGTYTISLGRTGERLLSSEDQDMYERLMAIGAHGRYLPDLIIYHYIPPERLTKSYYRRWCFWQSVSLGVIDRERPKPVTYLAGIPRYIYGEAGRSSLRIAKEVFSTKKDPAQKFSDELSIWNLIGFFYGKHFYRSAQ